MKISQDFHVEEFVPKALFKRWGEKSLWWVNMRVVNGVQKLRTNLGRKVFINDYMDGGRHHYRGFRPRNCTVGGELSQHRMALAVDVVVDGMSNEEVFEYLCNHWYGYDELGITTIENPKMTPGWTHIDWRPKLIGIHPEKMFLIVDPI